MNERFGAYSRETGETRVAVEVGLDGSGTAAVDTGYGFADHMLNLLAFWAGFDLKLTCRGDLEVDAHHSLEDVAICLGEALRQALGDRAGIARVGVAKVPMDEALCEAVVDLSGRAYLVYRENVLPPVIAGEEKDVWREFFKAFCHAARANVHIHYEYGQNGHHLVEAAFKALGLALRRATAVDGARVPSTKGSLD
ncbi:MAG: imidazoleglycerol-phosphate dehydratase HisB [Solidesulfovibrio sp.]|uniref:imidazoleglycerol-phosphate dehydratase HisB n=1 Tax=Solidesulfovibrio sp. TaxID=2910990 RepID=UPI002B1EDB99|nr:imidazoleglycerol-phosphate dehydratase HisB [Solidesulfovibrio sp.]MEA4855768.1 imidazoleglycerol-phosphate dehydratase HisB [Solidesulfovibrio sp.]